MSINDMARELLKRYLDLAPRSYGEKVAYMDWIETATDSEILNAYNSEV